MGRVGKSGWVAATLLVLAGSAAEAQYRVEFSFCDRLQQRYVAALNQAGGAASGARMVEIDRVGRQLAQAQASAQRNNCGGGLFFGARPSPACPAIVGEINRLSRQLSQLRGNSGFGGFFGYSPQYEVARLRDLLAESGCGVPGAGGYRTLCVRICDGYYFPINATANSSRFATDAVVCQSMYAADGQAELYVQPNSGEVGEATSFRTGRRYADQAFAFLYRDTYVPACAGQLKEGIAALAARFRALVRARPSPAPRLVATGPLPRPVLRQPRSEDPETVANAAGGFRVEPVEPGAAVAYARAVRMVGPEYYADLFDLTKALKEQALRRSFSLIDSAAAAEKPEPIASPVTPPAE